MKLNQQWKVNKPTFEAQLIQTVLLFKVQVVARSKAFTIYRINRESVFPEANREYVYILFIKNDSSWNNVPFQILSCQDKTYREIYDGISLKRYGTKFG